MTGSYLSYVARCTTVGSLFVLAGFCAGSGRLFTPGGAVFLAALFGGIGGYFLQKFFEVRE